MASTTDLTGTRVEEYELIRRLGGGGMGVVYEGRAPDGRRVAIKTLRGVFERDSEVVARFDAEAGALKALSHRALVQIVSIGQLEDGTHYFVMEFVEGQTFEELIEKAAPLDAREVLPWMIEILDALEVVHAHGVIHRDLKPSNLFLARTGVGTQVKVIDFGVAKHTGKSRRDGHHTAISAVIGTPDYMSPEQVSGEAVTPASDLYALGCVLYELVTGRLPFEDDSEVKKMMMHMGQQAAPPSSIEARVPRAIDDLVAWMLQKDPAKRPPSAIALKRRLEEVLHDLIGEFDNRATSPSVPSVTEPELGAFEPKTEQLVAPVAPELITQPAQSGEVPRRRRRTSAVASPRVPSRVGPLLWLTWLPLKGPIPLPLMGWAVAAAIALIGIGALTAKLVRGAQPAVVPEPDPVEQPAAPGGDDADEVDEPDTESAPNAPAPVKHKRPAVPPKRKPAQRDKRHGR